MSGGYDDEKRYDNKGKKLTESLVLDAVVLVLVLAPIVPDGALLKAIYPYRFWSKFPHCSYGKPGQFALQLVVDVVSLGA